MRKPSSNTCFFARTVGKSVLFLVACSSVHQQALDEANHQDSLQAYVAFLGSNSLAYIQEECGTEPSSSDCVQAQGNLEAVRLRADALRWQYASETNTTEAYTDYLQDEDESLAIPQRHISSARSAYDALLWSDANGANELAPFARYEEMCLDCSQLTLVYVQECSIRAHQLQGNLEGPSVQAFIERCDGNLPDTADSALLSYLRIRTADAETPTSVVPDRASRDTVREFLTLLPDVYRSDALGWLESSEAILCDQCLSMCESEFQQCCDSYCEFEACEPPSPWYEFAADCDEETWREFIRIRYAEPLLSAIQAAPTERPEQNLANYTWHSDFNRQSGYNYWGSFELEFEDGSRALIPFHAFGYRSRTSEYQWLRQEYFSAMNSSAQTGVATDPTYERGVFGLLLEAARYRVPPDASRRRPSRSALCDLAEDHFLEEYVGYVEGDVWEVRDVGVRCATLDWGEDGDEDGGLYGTVTLQVRDRHTGESEGWLIPFTCYFTQTVLPSGSYYFGEVDCHEG